MSCDFDATRELMAPFETVAAAPVRHRGPVQDESVSSDPLDQEAARVIEGRSEADQDKLMEAYREVWAREVRA